MRDSSQRYVGWAVLREDLASGRVRRFKRCRSKAQAREEAAEANRQVERGVLFYAEYWSTSSTLDTERA